MSIIRNILIGLIVPLYILINSHNEMLEFRKPMVCPAPDTEDPLSGERQGLQPRRDFCLKQTNISQENIIFVRETSDPAMVNSVSKNRKVKMRKSIDLLPVIVE